MLRAGAKRVGNRLTQVKQMTSALKFQESINKKFYFVVNANMNGKYHRNLNIKSIYIQLYQ